MTGVLDIRLVRDLFKRGVTDLVYKPIAYDTFAAKVKALLVRKSTCDVSSVSDRTLSVSDHIRDVGSTLKAPLADVTNSFQATIAGLEKQHEELEAGFVGSVRVLTNLLHQLGYTKGSHAGRVEEMSVAMAQSIGLDKKDLRVRSNTVPAVIEISPPHSRQCR